MPALLPTGPVPRELAKSTVVTEGVGIHISEPSQLNLQMLSRDVNSCVRNGQRPLAMPFDRNGPPPPPRHAALAAIEEPPAEMIDRTMVGAPLPLGKARLVSHITFDP